MPELNPNITAFQRHFDVFDTAAHGGSTDGKVSREDIEAVANGDQYTAEQRAAAQYLLDHPDQYALLDTGKEGGGLYAADGDISREDIDAVVADSPLFDDTAAFVSDAPAIPAGTQADFDDPAAAAAQTEHVAQSSMGDTEASATTQFMHFVREHQDDPQWLQDYFAALGAEKTAQYLSNVADPNRYNDLSAEYANGEIDAARSALQGMYESGAINDADIARLVEHWAMADGDFNAGMAQLFGGMEGRRGQDMQNAFFRATSELALAGQDVANRQFQFSDDAIGRLSDGDRESLAAAGAYVLSQTSTENQVGRLIDLQADGGAEGGTIDRFISLAMANPTQVAAFDAYTYDADNQRVQDPDSRGPVGQEVAYDGVASLVNTLSVDSTYRGGPDRLLPPAPYSYSALQSVRDEVFYAASNGLDANRDQWQDNTTLKDGLSRILTSDFDRMVGEATAANGAGFDDEHPFPKALENFAQNVLFTDPTGGSRDATSQFLVDKLSTMINDVNTLNDADFAAKYDGSNQAQITHLAGAILGHIDNGLEQATQVASDKYETEKKGLEFGLDLAWALGQDGLKLLPGGNVISTILPDSVTGSETFGAIKGEIESMMREGLGDQAAELLLEKFPDLHADGALSGLTQELSEVVSVGNERDFLASLLSSYEYVDSNPAAQ